MESAVRTRLGKLPSTLLKLYEESYAQNIESCVEEEKVISKNAFKMLLCLQEPLRTEDFLLALRLCGGGDISLSGEDLVDLCSDFVVSDTELNVFRFSHLSVREFLEAKDEYRPDKTHALAVEGCLRYLSTSVVTKRDATGPAMLSFADPTSRIMCDGFDQAIASAFWKCDACNQDDLDLFERCYERGIICNKKDHLGKLSRERGT